MENFIFCAVIHESWEPSQFMKVKKSSSDLKNKQISSLQKVSALKN